MHERGTYAQVITAQHLIAKLRATPMAALVVVPDLVIRLHAEPVWRLAVLARLPRELLLDHEGFVSRLWDSSTREVYTSVLADVRSAYQLALA